MEAGCVYLGESHEPRTAELLRTVASVVVSSGLAVVELRTLSAQAQAELTARVVGSAAAPAAPPPLCLFESADGVKGVIEDADDAELFIRDARYRSGLLRPAPAALAERLAALTVAWGGDATPDACEEAAARLSSHGAAVITGFLGEGAARALAEMPLEGHEDRVWAGGKPGAGRGDHACLPDATPDALLRPLDGLVAGMKALLKYGEPAAERLQCCEFRSWPMLSRYEHGARYTYHLDNPRRRNSRLLTAVFYLNAGWEEAQGGALRLLEPTTAPGTDDAGPPTTILGEVSPRLDTLVLFWSDSVPHEVLPPAQAGGPARRALSVWYLCPSRGAEQLCEGSPLPMSGQSPAAAAAAVLRRVETLGWGQGGQVGARVMAWLRATAGASEPEPEGH